VTPQAGLPPAVHFDTVHFDIGRVTLHGYSPGQQARFVSSLRARLADLAAGDGLGLGLGLGPGLGPGGPPGAARRIGRLDAGMLRPGAPPEEAAERVAAALLAAIGTGQGARHD